ncbi:MAG: antibiotic biosynthesis monooxygenase, partial [Rhodospirillaceae bacterium]|nr:antibiotic biosynthesis monooxygenase [Rhodospirillaceae bacterium]
EVEVVKSCLPEHVRLTRAEPGCVSFDVTETDDPLVWNVEECFLDRAAFEFHQHRTRASAWWVATAEIAREFRVSGLD